MSKKQIIRDLYLLYNDNLLGERDECIVLNTIEFLGGDLP